MSEEDIEKKRFETYESFRKSRQRSESDFIENLKDQLDIGTRITAQYKKTVESLEKQNEELDKARAMQKDVSSKIETTTKRISTLNRIILGNRAELNNVKREMVENDNRILEIENVAQELVQRRLSTEQELAASLQIKEGLQSALNEKVREETFERQKSLDLTERITNNNREKEKIQEKINRGFISREDGEREMARLQQENIGFAGELLISQDAMNKASAEKVSLQERLNSETDKYEQTYERLNGIDARLVHLQKKKTQLQERNGELTEKEKNLNERNSRAETARGKLVERRKDLQKNLSYWAGEEAKALANINKLSVQLVFVKMLQLAYQRFVALDEAAEKFRRTTGFTVDQMGHIRKYAEEINIKFRDMGVTIEQAYKSAEVLSGVFGRTSLLTKEAMLNVSLMAQNLGVSEEVSAQVLENFMGIGNSSSEAAFDTMKLGVVLSKNAGVPFAKVMDDVAKASETTINMIGASPAKLLKAAIAARALGLDINKIAASQRKLLDFSSSINDELELSALLGKSISFQKARQLAFEGKTDEALKATLETVKAAGNFERMTVYQREQLAKAAGMELKDLSKALAVEKQRDEILYGADEEKRQQLLRQEEELRLMKERSEEEEKDLIRQNEKALAQEKMQGVMSKLRNIMDSLSIAFADVFEPIITVLSGFVVPLVKVVVGILKWTLIPLFKLLAFPLQEVGKWLSLGVVKLEEWVEKTKPVKEALESISKWFHSEESYWIKFGAGLFGLFLMGKYAKGGIMGLIKKPFSFIKEQMEKIPGIGKLFKKTPEVERGVSQQRGSGIKDFLTNLSEGLTKMGTGKVLAGALNLLAAAPGLLAIVPGAILGVVLGLTGKLIEKGLQSLSIGVGYMANTRVLLGAVGIALLGISILPFAYAMKKFGDVDWGAVGKGSLALIGFATAAAILGALMVGSKGIGALIFGAGLLGIAALGAALIPFASAAETAGQALKLFSQSISSSVNSIIRLSQIDLTKTALGVGAIGVALAKFGAGSAVAGIGSFVKNLLGGDPIAKLERLAKVGPGLLTTTSAMNTLASTFKNFSQIELFADSIDVLTVSIGKMNEELEKTSLLKLTALSVLSAKTAAAAPTSAGVATVGATGDGSGIAEKLDAIHEALIGGKVSVYMDGILVSRTLAKTT